MTSIRRVLILALTVAAACGDDAGNRLPDAPIVDGAPDAPPDGPDDVDLTVTLAGTGSGEVTSEPAGVTCGATCTAGFAPDTVVTLTAVPASDSVFGGWSGGCSGTSVTCDVTLAAASSVTATFTLASYTVTVSPSGAGTGIVTGGGITCGATCTTTVDHGTMMTLTASPAALSTFAGWGGPCSGTGTCVVTITADATITAAFALDDLTLTVARGGTGSGSIASSPSGIACPADCSETYSAGQMVALTATPSVGSTFAGWSGGGCAGNGGCMVTMNTALVVTATFTLATYTLTAAKAGNAAAGGTVTSTPAGISCGADCGEVYNHGQLVMLTATPGAGATFTGWSGGGCAGNGGCMVTMTAATTVTATFTLGTYTLTAAKAGNAAAGGTVTSTPAGISCGADCSEVYNHGQLVMLTATPGAGATFTGWSGGGCAGNGGCMVTMTAATTVTATFTLNTYTLTAAKAGNAAAGGTVSSTPAGISCGADCSEVYNHGQLVMLSATPGAGATFTGWSGGGCAGNGGCMVTMTAATTVTATFTLNTYTLTAAKNGTGTGTVTSTPAGISCGADCSEVYNHGQLVTLTATPFTGSAATNSVFAGWTGGGCSTGTCVVTMTAATTVTATFSIAPNVMFVTSAQYTGDLGTVAGADMKCQALASAAGLVGQGVGQNTSYVAWLSSSDVNASARIGSATGWVRRDGKPVFNTVADIAQDRIIYPPRLTESGADVGAAQRVWTGTGASGTYSGSQCSGGTIAVFPWNGTSGPTGTVGLASGNSSMFTNFSGLGCASTARLFCMGKDRTAVVSALPQAGRLAFTSSTNYVPDATGLTKADDICQANANSNGLPGTYRALLATSTATAISRFNTTGAPWVRVGDRLAITSTAAALGTPGLTVVDVVPNVTANGARLGNVLLWTGAVDPGTQGGTGLTCADWTSSQNKGYGGRAGDTSAGAVWFGLDAGPSCDAVNRRVVCLQL